MTTQPVECAIYNPNFGDRVRILIEYGGAWRPIFWIEIEKDGSIYLGPRKIEVTELRHGAYSLNGAQVRVLYSDGTEITDPDVRKRAKLSFHASGVINAPMGRRARRTPLRTLESQELLCVALFQHPSQFDAISQDTVRKRDVCLRYPVDEHSPFYARLFVAPSKKVMPVIQNSVAHQLMLMFEYPSTPEITALTLQMALCHGPQGPWPPYTYVLFETASTEKQHG
jgi:hypothetical protein